MGEIMLDELLREQLKVWPLAAENYAALGKCERKRIRIGGEEGFDGALQFNPARAVSTCAKTDAASIKSRPCFLCKENRPKEQYALPYECGPDDNPEKWEILVNPYPILPFHFTVASVEHRPQGVLPVEAMVSLAEELPNCSIFYNGAGAGASAPDHQHLQIVLKRELPLINYLEGGGDPHSLPYSIIYRKATPDGFGQVLIYDFASYHGLYGHDDVDYKMMNTYIWIGDDGNLHLLGIPRGAHRPGCYYAEGEAQRMVSPGAIDMAGLIILPRKEDFDVMDERDVEKILKEVGK